MAVSGQRSELGISGRGISRMPSLCCNVFDQHIPRTAPLWENFVSFQLRCLDGSKARVEGVVRLDFLRKEKNATRNKHQRAACVGMDKSSTVLMHCSKSTVNRVLLVGLCAHDALESFLG